MFTGIVTDVGTLLAVEQRGDRRLRIACGYAPETIALGASIACAGICLTVVASGAKGTGAWFEVDASAETARCTTLGKWEPGTRINLERALKVGDELGGHLMSGHVDGIATVAERAGEGDSERFVFDTPAALMPFVAPKGSIALDGTSLTVNDVDGSRFSVNLIPHTLQATTWGERRAGARVNLEIDMLARYVARLSGFGTGMAERS